MSESAGPPRRVLILSSGDALSRIACGSLVRGGEPWQVVGLLQTRFTQAAQLRLLRSALAAQSLYYAAYMQLEILAARRALSRLPRDVSARFAPRLAETVRGLGGAVHETTAPNGKSALSFARGLAPDLVLSIRPGHILRRSFIASFPLILNLHLTRLPFFRG